MVSKCFSLSIFLRFFGFLAPFILLPSHTQSSVKGCLTLVCEGQRWLVDRLTHRSEAPRCVDVPHSGHRSDQSSDSMERRRPDHCVLQDHGRSGLLVDGLHKVRQNRSSGRQPWPGSSPFVLLVTRRWCDRWSHFGFLRRLSFSSFDQRSESKTEWISQHQYFGTIRHTILLLFLILENSFSKLKTILDLLLS